MFGPTASPVVHAQSTWHIGPTTCVVTSRSFAWRETNGSSDSASHARIASSSPSSQRASAIASAADAQTKQLARVIRSWRTCVRIVPAAFAPRVIEAVRPPSVCASGTWTVSVARPVSRTSPASSSSYAPSSIVDRHDRDGDDGDAGDRLRGAGELLEVDRRDEPVERRAPPGARESRRDRSCAASAAACGELNSGGHADEDRPAEQLAPDQVLAAAALVLGTEVLRIGSASRATPRCARQWRLS